MTQYVHDAWNSNDGLPQDSVNAVVQTADGYIWFATQEGLVRFDGVRFTVFDQSNTDGMGGFVFTLFAARDGALWVGTGGGLLRYRDGKFTRYSQNDGLPDITIKNISEDASGNLWLGAASGNVVGGQGLTRFKDGRGTILTTRDGLSNNQIYKTLTDAAGDLWVATANGLDRYRNGEFTHFTTADGLAGNFVRTIYQDRAGALWFGTNAGLSRLKNGRFSKYTTKDGLPNDYVYSVCEDADGNLWVGTEKGLSRFENGSIRAAVGIEGLSSDRIFSLLEDAEGSLWVGTHASGLHRLRDGKFTAYGTPEGLAGDEIHGIFQDRAGRVWVGAAPGGLSVFADNRFTNYAAVNGLSSGVVRAFYEDANGAMWVGTSDGLSEFKNGKFTRYADWNGTRGDTVHTIYPDADGALLIGTDSGFSRLQNGRFANFGSAQGLASGGVNFFHRRADGSLDIGGNDRFVRFENGRFSARAEAMPAEFNVQSFAEDADGTLWVTTWGQGLNRFKDGKLTTYTTKDGIYDNAAWSILDDGAGDLWMGSNRGIFRVAKQELNDFADGKIAAVHSVVYGTADGMRKRETNTGSPSALRARDGRLWFATTGGGVVIDPRDIKTNRVPPPVVLEKMIADERAVEPTGANAELAAGTRNVEFQYVGLSFVAPERVKYKYKLEGFDKDWVDAETRHTAFYTNLPPGDDYRFRVIAANDDGVWNETGATVKFRVLAPFWRTWWFYGLAVLVAAGIVFSLFKGRVRRLERANEAQIAFSRRLIESQEQERKRIAAELHDTLGQHLVIIKNWATLGLKFLDKDAPAREQLEVISATALQAIDEVREIVHDLRPFQLEANGLTQTIKFMVEGAAAASGIEFTVECDELDGFFAAEDDATFYRAVQECVSNVIKHSGATRADVRIKRDGRHVRLRISDDGSGFAPEATAETSGGGFGLNGLRERVGMLGGVPEIESTPGRGTTISINLETNRK